MEFFFLFVLMVLIGFLANNYLLGAAIGIFLWLLFGHRTNQRLQSLSAEIDRLKRRLAALERGGGAEAAMSPPVETPTPTVGPAETEALPPAEPINRPRRAPAAIPKAVPAPSAPPTPPAKALPQTEALPPAEPDEEEEEFWLGRQRPAAAGADSWDENPFVAWLLRGNPLLKAGIGVLFLGLAFLLRYASERIHIPVELRYLAVAGAGLAALVGGWRLQTRRRDYGLMLQGFGVAVMYLTALAALKLHGLLTVPLTFLILVALVGLMIALALKQNAPALAQVAVLGGLATPQLVSAGPVNPLVLFGYLALLNAGVAAIAWFKAWRPLNLTGAIGTFAIASLWGARYYTPALFARVEPFLIYFWLLYGLIAYFFARNRLLEGATEEPEEALADNAPLATLWAQLGQAGRRVHLCDHSLLFGTMAAAFALQYRLTAHWPAGGSLSALAFAAVYGLAAWYLRWESALLLLRQAFVALTLLFLTLAVPLYFDRSQTALFWTAEAALAYGFGLHQRLPLLRLGALTIYLLAALAQLTDYRAGTGTLLAGSWFSTLLTLVGGGAIYLLWQRERSDGSALWERRLQGATLTAALVYASLLPPLFWAERGSLVGLAALAALWGQGWRRWQFNVFAVFALLNGLLVLALHNLTAGVERGPLSQLHLFAAAPLLLAAAGSLQCSEAAPGAEDERSLARVAGWPLLLIGLLLGGSALYGQWTGSETTFTRLWTLPLLAAPLLPAARWLRWRELSQTLWALLPLFALHCLSHHLHQPWTLATGLPLAAVSALNFPILASRPRPPRDLHRLNVLLLLLLWTLWAGRGLALPGVWGQLAWLAPSAALWLTLHWQRSCRFLRRHRAVYWDFARPLCVGVAAGWLLWVNWATPQLPLPLPYLPLLNPLELAAAGLLYLAWQSLPPTPLEGLPAPRPLIAALAWYTLSAGVMRLWHFYGAIPWQLGDLLRSFGLQASLSVVWALTAIGLMLGGHRRRQRSLWLTGAGLMALVVAKLFLIELANRGGIARIASFISVGLLLLLVSWFAPAPPAAAERSASPSPSE